MRERERNASRARRGAARARVIWRRQVIDSPSGDNARRPQRASLYPVTGTGQTAYISKAIAGDPASRGHSTRGFLSRALIHAYPRRPTQLIDIRRSRRHLRTREDGRRRKITLSRRRRIRLCPANAAAGGSLAPTSVATIGNRFAEDSAGLINQNKLNNEFEIRSNKIHSCKLNAFVNIKRLKYI